VTTGSDLLTRASTILQDDAHVRWPLPELVNWINDAMRAVILAKPSANAQSLPLSLVYGTRQSLTNASHLALLRLPRNLTEVTPQLKGGRVIRPISRELLDSSEPSWHDPLVVPYKKEVRQYVYDEASPREFYVYPGNLGDGLVEAVVSVLPAALTASADPDVVGSYAATLGLPEPWAVALLDFVLYRAFSKDDIAAEVSRSRLHYQAFAAAVGIKVQVEGANSPNARAKVVNT